MAKLQKDFIRVQIPCRSQKISRKNWCRNWDIKTAGIICETEAYCGTIDPRMSCHNRRFTDRTTDVMYAKGGKTMYIYVTAFIIYLIL